jgi:hypothetical protein
MPELVPANGELEPKEEAEEEDGDDGEVTDLSNRCVRVTSVLIV